MSAPDLVPPDPPVQVKCDACAGGGYVPCHNPDGYPERDPETGHELLMPCDECGGRGWYVVPA